MNLIGTALNHSNLILSHILYNTTPHKPKPTKNTWQNQVREPPGMVQQNGHIYILYMYMLLTVAERLLHSASQKAIGDASMNKHWFL